MPLNMNNLSDIEKYFLLELSYCDNPNFPQISISPDKPIHIEAFLDSVPECYCSFLIPIKMKFKNVESYMTDSCKRLREVYEGSPNLKDIEIIGYINDNYNFLGNTKDKRKTGLVAFALRDKAGNGMVIYRGCELNYASNIVLDWSGCVVAALGYDTRQHIKALDFFDQYISGLPGEKNILGHSKGGNLATYVFINRKTPLVNSYVVNAQPYCWFAMTSEQKAWLKSSQYEYIVHSNDPTKAASYVSYISRVIPLNRYKEKDIIATHLFTTACFDDYGNLEGGRIFRKTTSKVLARVFDDFASETLKNKEELLELFSKQMSEINNSSRVLSIGMDEIMLALNAEAATLWLKYKDSDGDIYIYPFLIKGPVNDELYKLKLHNGEGIAADSAFNGNVHIYKDMNQSNKFLDGIDGSTGFSSKSTVTVPIHCSEDKIIGSLQILNKRDAEGFTNNDLDMALAISKIIGKYVNEEISSDNSPDFTLLAIKRGENIVFEIEKNQYKEVTIDDKEYRKQFLLKITGKELDENEMLMFNRERFFKINHEELKKLRKFEISVIFENPDIRNSNIYVKKLLLSKIKDIKEKGISKSKIIKNPDISKILHKRVSELTEDEYIEFEMALALLNRPMLIIIDFTNRIITSEKALLVIERVKELVNNKITTAIVLQ